MFLSEVQQKIVIYSCLIVISKTVDVVVPQRKSKFYFILQILKLVLSYFEYIETRFRSFEWLCEAPDPSLSLRFNSQPKQT